MNIILIQKVNRNIINIISEYLLPKIYKISDNHLNYLLQETDIILYDLDNNKYMNYESIRPIYK